MTPNTHYPTRGMGDLSFTFYTSTADADASAKGRSQFLPCAPCWQRLVPALAYWLTAGLGCR